MQATVPRFALPAEYQALPMLLSVKQAAKAANVSKDFIYESIATGHLAAVRLSGRAIRIDRLNFLAWIGLRGYQ